MVTIKIINHERVFISPLSKFQTCLIPLGFVFHENGTILGFDVLAPIKS